METEDFAALIMKAAAEFNAKMQKQAYERASPSGDSAELLSTSAPAPRTQPRPETVTLAQVLPMRPADARWQQQIQQSISARGLDLERRRAKNKR